MITQRRATSLGLLLLRVGAFALILAFHVRPKLAHFDDELAHFPDPLGVGHAASFLLALGSEAACGGLVAAGVLTRLSSIPLLITMSMVLLLGARGFAGADVQSALLYALPYSALVLLGPGEISVDAHLAPRYRALLPRWKVLEP